MQKLGLGVLARVSGGGSNGVTVSADGGVSIVGSSKVVTHGNTYTGDTAGHKSGRSSKKS